MTKQLISLRKSLELDEREREGFMKRQIQHIFSGNFGKTMAIYFRPFLNAPIDTKEKEEAWLNIVNSSDEVESVEYSEEILEMYENLTNEYMERLGGVSAKLVKK